MEGVAFNTKWSLKYVEKFIKRKLPVLNFIGGGAMSDAWCQIFADILDRRIRRVKDPLQANARGAAFIASAGLGYISFEDIPNLIEYDRIFTPDPANRKIYQALYREFVQLYKKTKGICRRLNNI